jgi:hypothetical protein
MITVFWDVTLCSLVDHNDTLEECTASIFRVVRFEVLIAVTMKRQTEISYGEFLIPYNMETMVEDTSSEVQVTPTRTEGIVLNL